MSCRDAVYSNDYYNFIIRNSAYLAGYEPGECHIDLDSLYTIEFAKREGLPPLSLGNYTYASIPKCYTLLGEEALEATGIPDVRDLPSLALQGNGILMGFVDTGINYQLPAFLDEAGESRIVALWDQTGEPGQENLIPRENAALGVLPPYGTVYIREGDQPGLGAGESPGSGAVGDENGHGSFVASVAGREHCGKGQVFRRRAPGGYRGVKVKEAKQYLKVSILTRMRRPP